MHSLTGAGRAILWVAAGLFALSSGLAAAAVTDQPLEGRRVATFGGVSVRGKLVPRVAPIAEMCPEKAPGILAGSTTIFVAPPIATPPAQPLAGDKPKPPVAKRAKLAVPEVLSEEVGLVQVDVQHDRPLYIAVSWGEDGTGEWTKELLEKDDMPGRGWVLVGKLPMRLGESRSARWLYWRQAKAGDSFRLRTRKTVAPIVIVPPAGAADPLGDRSSERFSEDLTQGMLKAKAWYLLQQEKFDELEVMIAQFRNKPARFGTGTTKLHVTYLGLSPYNVRDAEQWKQYLAHVEGWSRAKPASTTPLVVWAEALRGVSVGNAWFGRHMKWAELDGDQRKALLDRSVALCEDARKLDDRDPELYRTLVLLAIPCDWPPERVNEFLRRSAALNPGYLSTFAQAAHYFGLNRGDESSVNCADVARQAVELTKSASGRFAYSIMALESRHYLDDELFKPENFSWETTRQGFIDAEGLLPHSDTRDHEFCRLACIAGDRKTAAELFHKLNGRRVERFDQIWRDKHYYGAWQAWAQPDYLAGEQTKVLVDGHEALDGLCWSADGSRLVTVNRAPQVQVWDPNTGSRLATQGGLQHVAMSLAISADGRLAATGDLAREVWLYGFDGKPDGQDLGKQPRAVSRVRFSPDGTRLASGNRGGSIWWWDVASGKQIAMWPTAHDQMIRGLDFTPDGTQLVSCGDDHRTRFWDVASGKLLGSLPDSANKLVGLAISPDGKLLALADTRFVTLWRLPGRERIGKLEGDARSVNEMAFSADSTKLACATGALNVIAASDAIVWDVPTQRRLRLLHGHKAAVTGIAFSPDGKQIATASLDMTVRLWNTSN
jgi:WD40 repeat protein